MFFLPRNKVGVSPGISRNDVESTGEIEAPLLIEHGRWFPARFGTEITCKQWRALDGGFHFLFDGRLMFGPGTTAFWIFVICHILMSMAFFLTFETNFNAEWTYCDWIMSSIAVISSIASIWYIFQTVFTEPGCIPIPDQEKRLQNLVQYHFEKEPGAKTIEMKMDFNGKEQICSFCDKCCQFKPKRAVHCEYCGFCIDRKVHHCCVFGVCLGRRNYRFFFSFLVSVNVLFATTLSVSITRLITLSAQVGFQEAFMLSPTTFVLAIGLICPPFGIIQMFLLLIQHFVFILADVTFSDLQSQAFCAGLKAKGCLGTIQWMASNFHELVMVAPPKSLLSPRSYIRIRVLPRNKQVVKKAASAGFPFWVCGLNTGATASPKAPKLNPTNAACGGHPDVTSPTSGNPFLQDDCPKTRGVYTLPSCCPDARKCLCPQPRRSRLESLRILAPFVRNEAAEPAPSAGQLQQQLQATNNV